MQSSDDRPVGEWEEAVLPGRVRARRAREVDSFLTAGTARTAPRGADSRSGDDETHRRLQEARNRALHSTESLIRRELGPDWAEDQ